MELSCKSQYALLALLELAAHYPQSEPLQIRQIASQHHIPERYLEQLLATLKRSGLVRSQRGAKGGYLLAKEPWKITLFDVVVCLEGSNSDSTRNSRHKSLESLVVGEVWQEADQMANSIWQKYTLKDLCEKLDAKRQTNLMYYI
ncbi:MAG: Rrf2 family transcriptional regulator [Limnoraphis robusta]|uniref:Rrf2 family transcriptional regulator n=1 Tax=Limnoraphis robusta CCNP1315 TaxID=3110306 RepID=A0ABU5TT15_9CYAN|nr:Rrf2 family transcriptional regulator [Limnoraphis robusta]MEA5517924.1 Rrf2 family transcriptional regulator [Limnoraphis robusta CCNP1315]MEA5538976.1 Rrf2 family transcriptional regulator [Limnoraphis robusta Tam1]MEA5543735.1 Rrf2 family transcriptional regulator [Limnoraphis robusta CCNP1324]